MIALMGVGCTVAGAAVITAYTIANYRLRRRGAGAVWFGGWILGASAMTLTGVGWGLLGLAGPHYRVPVLQALGLIVSLGAGWLYFYSAVHVGRLRARQAYDLGLYREGIYRFVRHPQALALCLLAVGVGVFTLSRPFLLGLPAWVGFWIVYAWCEERFELIPAYGADYLRYMRTTGRLLPRLAALRRRKDGD